MAYICHNKLWESEFDNIVSKKDKVQDVNLDQLKLEIRDTYEKVENLTTFFETSNDEDVISKASLVENLLEIDGHLSFLEKDSNEFKLHYNIQYVEEMLVQRTLKTTIQILYDKGIFDNFLNADKVLKNFLRYKA